MSIQAIDPSQEVCKTIKIFGNPTMVEVQLQLLNSKKKEKYFVLILELIQIL